MQKNEDLFCDDGDLVVAEIGGGGVGGKEMVCISGGDGQNDRPE